MRASTIRIGVLVFAGQCGIAAPPTVPSDACRRWIPQITNPSRRVNHAMSYDSRRGVTVLFGSSSWWGVALDAASTWEWDGEHWTLRANSGPGLREAAAMAYDERRGVTVLFGGFRGLAIANDTWEWDGSDWNHRANDGPPGISGPKLVYDQQRGRSVLFGLRVDENWVTAACETWAWDGNTWTLLDAIPSCSLLQVEGLAYDRRRDVIVLLGQASGPPETWEWDGSTWNVRHVDEIDEFHPHDRKLVYDARRRVTVAFGGEPYYSETMEWDGVGWTLRELPSQAPGRSMHALAYDSSRGVTVLFGGYGRNTVAKSHPTDDTWEYDGASWVRRREAPPALCYGGVSPVYDRHRGQMVVHSTLSTWEVRDDDWTAFPSPEPIVYGSRSLVFDQQRSVPVLLGLSTSDSYEIKLEVREWIGTHWSERPAFDAQMGDTPVVTYDVRRGETLAFDGYTDWGGFGKLWAWNGSEWRLASSNGPSARSSTAIAYDQRRDRVVLFGGACEAYTNLGDTWEWDGQDWFMVSVDGPSPRYGHDLVYDEARGVSILRGGWSNAGGFYQDFEDHWEWDGTNWAARVYGGPEYDEGTMTFDSSKGVPVLFATRCDIASTRVWELRPGPRSFDFDADCDVDLLDFAAFQNCTGATSDASACLNEGVRPGSTAPWMYLMELVSGWIGPATSLP